jgi:hypoxanthine phosphoribosyltransferase
VRRVVYTAEEIAGRVADLGREISVAYPADEPLLVLGLLKGSFIFMADLVRRIARPVTLDFLVAASYGSGTVTSGDVQLLYDPETSAGGQARDPGGGHRGQRDHHEPADPLLEARRPRSLEICALLHKRLSVGPGPGAALGRVRRAAGVSGRVRARSRRELQASPFIGSLESPQ